VLYGCYPRGDALTPPGVADAIVAAVRAHWGLGSRLLSDIFLGGADAAEQERFARLQRESATAETAAALLSLVYRLDVRAHLPLVRQPATVVHRRDDRAVPYRLGREVAAAIPGATFIPLQGSSHFPWHGDVDSVVRACRQALTQQQSRPTDAGELEPALRWGSQKRPSAKDGRIERCSDYRAARRSSTVHRTSVDTTVSTDASDNGRRSTLKVRFAKSHACSVAMGGCYSSNTSARSRGFWRRARTNSSNHGASSPAGAYATGRPWS
jgi:hypothetical protein